MATIREMTSPHVHHWVIDDKGLGTCVTPRCAVKQKQFGLSLDVAHLWREPWSKNTPSLRGLRPKFTDDPFGDIDWRDL